MGGFIFCYTLAMQKSLKKQFAQSFLIFVGLTILLACFMLLTGMAHVATQDGNSEGIYNPAGKGLPSYWNPLYLLAICAEFLALISTPVLIFGLRRKTHITWWPWLIALLVACVFTVTPFSWAGAVFDPEVDSYRDRFLFIELYLMIGFIAGYGSLNIFTSRPRRKT